MENIKLKRFATHINTIIFASGAEFGSDNYSAIRDACCDVLHDEPAKSTGDELHDLAREMRVLQTEKDDLKDALKGVDARLDEIRLKLIPDIMNDRDIRTVTFADLGRVQLAMDLYATILDKEAGYAWLTEHGFDGLVQPYVQPGTFKSAVKEALKADQEFPEELFKIDPFMRASIVKTRT